MSRFVISAVAVLLWAVDVPAAHAQSRGKSGDSNPFGRYGDPDTKPRTRSGQTSTAPRVVPASRPAQRSTHNYFPEMRTGQGPNYNVPAQPHRCVPGRRGLMLR